MRESDEAKRLLGDAAKALPDDLRSRLRPAIDRGRWYRGTFHVNLPDAPDGHAVLELVDGRARLETSSAGFRVPAG